MDAAVRARFDAVPYAVSLGIALQEATAQRIVLCLPFKEENANPGRVLHGGVTASMIDAAGALAGAAALGAAADWEVSTLDLSVDYLAAAIGEELIATAEVLRRGKELVYSSVDVRTDAGKRIAVGLSTVRGVSAATANAAQQLAAPLASPVAGGERIEHASLFVRSPFMARLAIAVEQAHGGSARLAMACTDDKCDADGAVHEGALAALIDSSGALSAWSVVGLDLRAKASTVGMHVSFHRRMPGADVVAHARTRRRNNEIFANEVAAVARASGEVLATGTVTYRIVMP
jgi:uncharacterized protein (TIGR00369 family)